jgi:predicted PurR-regulated permease PerM
MSNIKRLVIVEPSPLRWIQYIVYGSVVLYFAKPIFIPISFALLISFVLYPVCAWFERKGLGRLTAIVISIALLLLMGLLLVGLLIQQFMGFVHEWPAIQTKVTNTTADMIEWIEMLGVSRDTQNELLTRITNQSGGNIVSVIKDTLAASASSIVLLILVPVYAVLILYYRSYWMKILGRVFPQERTESLRNMIALTIGTYYQFIKGMAFVYIVVGSLNSIGLLLLGVPHAILFGFVASILTFIPYVGIMVGSLLPMTMAWITYDSVWYPLGIVAIFAFVQYLEANIIFPVAVSNRLNVNTLVMLIAIFAGGVVWGVAGMILFVPFVGIAKLIADHNPKWKTVSMILGTEK